VAVFFHSADFHNLHQETSMDDERIWEFEKSLWSADSAEYHHKISRDAIMVVPQHPFVLAGPDVADSMAQTPRWDSVVFSETKVARPDGPNGGLIVIAYKAEVSRGDIAYTAYCTSTLLREGEDDWVVVQHQQTPLPATGG